jgi:hypothetical protein
MQCDLITDVQNQIWGLPHSSCSLFAEQQIMRHFVATLADESGPPHKTWLMNHHLWSLAGKQTIRLQTFKNKYEASSPRPCPCNTCIGGGGHRDLLYKARGSFSLSSPSLVPPFDDQTDTHGIWVIVGGRQLGPTLAATATSPRRN